MATIKVTFKDGVGTLNAKLYRDGIVVEVLDMVNSGENNLNCQSGDFLSVGGSCAGTADILMDIPTTPSTPLHDTAGPINHTLMIN